MIDPWTPTTGHSPLEGMCKRPIRTGQLWARLTATQRAVLLRVVVMVFQELSLAAPTNSTKEVRHD